MQDLEKQVRRVRRRLSLQRFLLALGWCWSAALAAAVLAVAAGKVWPQLAIHPTALVASALGVGLLPALVLWYRRRPSPTEAALAIDSAFDLRERLSSAFSLAADARQTDAGRALLADAARRAAEIDVTEKIGLAVPRVAALPLLPALLIFLVATLVSPRSISSQASAKPTDPQEAERVVRSAKILNRQLSEERKEAEKKGLDEAAKLLGEVEKAARETSQLKDADQKKTLQELNNLADSIKERRADLGGSEQMKQFLDKLRDTPNGPADRFKRALEKGNFQKAVQELNRLKESLAKGQLGEKEKQALQQQLKNLQDQLQKLADAQKRKEALEAERKQLQQQGKSTEKVDKELAKLASQTKQLEQLQKLAQKLGQCQSCMAKGDMQKALESLEGAKSDLEALAKQLDELQLLDAALDELARAKASMDCGECNGMGCAACQGDEFGRPGRGLGQGRGTGDRPEKEDQTANYDTQTRQQLRKGKAFVTDLVPGQQVKGESHLDIKQAVEQAKAEAPDALTQQKLPRAYKAHAKKYFDGLSGQR